MFIVCCSKATSCRNLWTHQTRLSKFPQSAQWMMQCHTVWKTYTIHTPAAMFKGFTVTQFHTPETAQAACLAQNKKIRWKQMAALHSKHEASSTDISFTVNVPGKLESLSKLKYKKNICFIHNSNKKHDWFIPGGMFCTWCSLHLK